VVPYFEDERWFGQQGILSKVWAKSGSRPTAVRQTQYGYVHVLAVASPVSGHSEALIAPVLNAGVVNTFLDQFSKTLPADTHAALIGNAAGYHTAKAILCPFSRSHAPTLSRGEITKRGCGDDTGTLHCWESNCLNPRITAMDRIENTLHHLKSFATCLIVLGVVLVVLGIAALMAPWVFTLTSVMIFGWMLILGGVAGTVNAIVSKGWHGFGIYLLIGILDVVVGFLLVSKPLQAASIVTLVLAVLFLAGGFGRILTAVIVRFPHWGSAVLGGLVSVLLGGMIWAEWPESTLWVIGTFIGIELLFRGLAWISLGMTAKRAMTPNV